MKKTNKLTLEEFRFQVDQIHAEAGDWEVTHSMEDSLKDDLIFCAAEGQLTKKELKAMWEMLLELKNYPKWYA